MIKIQYDREKNSTLVSCGDMTFIDHLLPLRVDFVNIVTGEIHSSSNLYSNMWSCWNGAELITDVIIYTNNNEVLEKYEWSIIEHGDEIEKMLWYYLVSRRKEKKQSNGLVIGTHDGRNGHWIYPIKHNLSKATLIDGSEKQFLNLKENYRLYNNVKLKNNIVTVEGGPVTWYSGGQGYTDTVVKNLISEWLHEEEIHNSQKNSVPLNEVMKEESYDWIHLDVEGIDDELILNLKTRPNIIIFESMNLSEDRMTSLNSWFYENNYSFLTCNGNTIAFKKLSEY